MKSSYYIALLLGIGVCTFAVGYRLMVPGTDAEVLTAEDQPAANPSGLKPPPGPAPTGNAGPAIVSNQASPEADQREDTPPTTRRPLIAAAPDPQTSTTQAGPLIAATQPAAGPLVRTEPATQTTAEPDTGPAAQPAERTPENPANAAQRPGTQRTVLRATAPEAQPGPRTYTVQEGDTLSTISDKLYGTSRFWVDLARANPTVDPIRLQIGQTIVIPEIDAEIDSDALTEKEDGIRAPQAVQRHTIRPGESLSSISVRYYGTATHWRVIFNANRSSIGPDPNAIRAGMNIVIPSVPVRESSDD